VGDITLADPGLPQRIASLIVISGGLEFMRKMLRQPLTDLK
jgi:hypothetical protein